jgi:hypothetical protein
MGLAAWHWGPDLWMRASVLYWQRRSLVYTAPQDQVVYDDGPDASTQWTGIPGYTWASSAPTQSSWGYHYACFAPAEWAHVQALTVIPPTVWTPLDGPTQTAAAFLHRCTRSDGTERLVCVRVFSTYPIGDDGTHLSMQGWVVQPAKWSGPVQPTLLSDSFFLGHIPARTRCRVLAGQSIVPDGPRLCVIVELNGRRHAIDCQLNDKDVLEFLPQDGHWQVGGAPCETHWWPDSK